MSTRKVVRRQLRLTAQQADRPAKFLWLEALAASTLNAAAIRVALVLSNRDNFDGQGCRWTDAQITSRTGMSRSTIGRARRDLEAGGWIEVVLTGHGGKPSTYRMTTPEGAYVVGDAPGVVEHYDDGTSMVVEGDDDARRVSVETIKDQSASRVSNVTPDSPSILTDQSSSTGSFDPVGTTESADVTEDQSSSGGTDVPPVDVWELAAENLRAEIAAMNEDELNALPAARVRMHPEEVERRREQLALEQMPAL